MNYNYNNDQKSSNEYCVITEQGDLGLGADVLKETDQRILENQMSENKPQN